MAPPKTTSAPPSRGTRSVAGGAIGGGALGAGVGAIGGAIAGGKAGKGAMIGAAAGGLERGDAASVTIRRSTTAPPKSLRLTSPSRRCA